MTYNYIGVIKLDLYKEILIKLLEKESIQISFSACENIESLFEKKCYKALTQIKEALNDYTLEDRECFLAIESIMEVFEEELGFHSLERHDFG